MNVAGDLLWKSVQRKRLQFWAKQSLATALHEGASVVLEGIDILDSRIAEITRSLEATMPCSLSNCEAFWSNSRNEAYGGHTDSDDVLVVQIEGSKHWRIHEPQNRRFKGNSPLTEQQMGPVLTEIVMNPGDVLFLRAGVPHKCSTPGEFSLHLSFDLIDRYPNIDQITNIANQIYKDAAVAPHEHPEHIVGAYQEVLERPDFREELKNAAIEMRTQVKAFREQIIASSESPLS